jgi:Uma2 family endonuclease
MSRNERGRTPDFAATQIAACTCRSCGTRSSATTLEAGTNRAILEVGYILAHDPLTIRQPDVSVISRERIRATNPDSYFEGAPELAIEIVSPSDSAEDLDIKTKQYLQNGARQVWILYPKTQTVHIFSRGAAIVILDQDQTLEGGDVLPGFTVPVASLFAI